MYCNSEDDELSPYSYHDESNSSEQSGFHDPPDITIPYNPEDMDDVWCPFSYQNPDRTPAISKAVMKGDFEGIKLLLESDEGVNSPDNNGNTPLHLAIINNASMEILNLLLTHPDIDLESENCIGYTPLLYGLLHKNETSPDIIMQLIEAGCSVNAKNNRDESTMHLAVTYHHSDSILVKLIEKGVDINAQDCYMYTPLHRAVDFNNEAAMYVLLYYEADVSISCKSKKYYWNPFIYALSCHSDLAQILFDYYDFNDPEEFGFGCFRIATKNIKRIAIDLLKAGVNVNYDMPETDHPIYNCIKYPDSELFRKMWPRVDYEQIIQGGFLDEFIEYCNFPTSEWLECCYLILNCSYVSELINPPIYSEAILQSTDYLLHRFLLAFNKNNVQKTDRLTIIYIFLSYGAIVDMQTLHFAYLMYGPNEELEILIQAFDQHQLESCIYKYCYVFLLFYVVSEEIISRNDIVVMIATQIKQHYDASQNFHEVMAEESPSLHTLQLFSLTLEEKCRFLELFSLPQENGTIQNSDMHLKDSVLTEKLKFVPDIPSLIELSRNQTRKFIKQSFKIKQPYEFYDIVKRLKIPYAIQDIITLKKPIYVLPMYT